MSAPARSKSGRRPGKAAWEAVLSAGVGVGTLLLGIMTWWDARAHQLTPDPRPDGVPSLSPRLEKRPDPEAASPPAPTTSVLKLSNGSQLSYYRNFALDAPHPEVEQAAIVVSNYYPQHTADFFAGVLEQARRVGRDRTTLILVPVFPTSTADLRPDEPVWEKNWEIGAESQGSRPISTFRVVDELFGLVTDPHRFPNVRSVVLAGNGLAGTFVNRYSAGGNPRVADRGAGRPVEIRYVIFSAPSYLYLDRLRPVAGTDGFAEPAAGTCPDFNRYRYGLERRNRAMSLVPLKTLRARLFGRQATYVVGAGETGAERHDGSCAAMLQGGTRYERAANYWRYIQRFPGWREHVTFHPLAGVGHISLVNSDHPEVAELLFGRKAP